MGELARAVRGRGGARSTAFLSDRQQELARAALAALRFDAYRFCGGYPEAERRILCLFGGMDEGEPAGTNGIACLLIESRARDCALTHRDYLGALLSMGVKRECIGDILPGAHGAYVFVLARVAPLLCDELARVGRCEAHARMAVPEELPLEQERSEQQATVASLRLDAVLAAMLRISRGDAVRLVRSGAVEVNHVSVALPHYEVYENDTFSIRGRGKYRLCGVGAQSRKGRTFVSYIEY